MISLGCDKNRVDGERLLGEIVKRGHSVTSDLAEAQVLIVNTCAFLESARKEAIEAVLEGNAFRGGKLEKLVVSGCLPEKFIGELFPALTEGDVFLGVKDADELFPALERAYAGERVNAVGKGSGERGERVVTTPSHIKYLKIADGCFHRCTYCLIPSIRGKYVSYPEEELLSEAAGLGETDELILVAQDTTRYGLDLYGEYKLAELLRELCKISGFKWIRILYCYPDKITDELINVIKTEDKICKYIDIPLQHCNGNVLKRMNRSGNRETLLNLMKKLRTEIPNIVIRTTFIAGFPGETEEEFTELCEFIKEVKFQRMGCFPYSMEEGTEAAEFPDQIDEDVKIRRAEIITEQQSFILDSYLEGMIGSETEVLCEGYDRYAECYFGRTSFDAPDVDTMTFFTATGKKPVAGEFYTIKITDFMDSSLIGEIVQ